jgi:hypothetical protein
MSRKPPDLTLYKKAKSVHPAPDHHSRGMAWCPRLAVFETWDSGQNRAEVCSASGLDFRTLVCQDARHIEVRRGTITPHVLHQIAYSGEGWQAIAGMGPPQFCDYLLQPFAKSATVGAPAQPVIQTSYESETNFEIPNLFAILSCLFVRSVVRPHQHGPMPRVRPVFWPFPCRQTTRFAADEPGQRSGSDRSAY